MRTDRRGFLGLAAGALGALALAPRARAAGSASLEIHHLTANTRPRALGSRLAPWRRAPAEARGFPGAERVALPALAPGSSRALAETVRGLAPAAGFREGALPLAELARLLHLTNGVTGSLEPGGLALRAAPSAGALYAGELYLLAGRVDGLAPGLYHFAVPERALVRVRASARMAELAAALEEPEQLEGALFAVLFTNVFGRYTARYRSRGYRYALIDTGHIAENLRLASAAAGLGERGFARFEDARVDAFLGLDARAEAVCWVSAVGHPRPARDAAPGDAQAKPRPLVESDPRAAFAPGGSAERYHRASALVPGAGAAPAPRDEAPEEAAPAGEPLLARADPPVSVDAAILARRSALAFVPEAIAPEALAFALEIARAGPALAPGVELHAVVHRVRGVAPGLYEYRGGRLVPRSAGDLREALVRACLGQEKAALAAVGLVMAARVDEIAAREGARAYRDLLVESGAIAERLYLAAEAVGLAARNLAAFLDAELDALLGFGPDGRVALHLTMLGLGA